MSIQINVSIRTRVEALLQHLCKGLYEREEAVKLALLSALAGESIFLLGPPGVGKSLIARRLKYAFKDGISFEYLMSKFSTPDEVFGPVSIKKLKEEDKYERLTDRYLPGANIVFLDEIWKAGPAIQNALLTILNEKIYRNGEQDIKVNIRGIITASNELPPKNQSLAPIWDRFLVRLELGNIQTFKNFLDMITDTSNVYEDNIRSEVKISEAELEEWTHAIDQTEVPAEVLNTIQLTKIKLDEHNARPNNSDNQILIFDRRWKKIIRLLRTAAFLNGRTKVDLMDCFLMIDCLWAKPSQKGLVKDIVAEAVQKHGYTLAVNLNMIRKEVEDFEVDVNEEIQVKHTITEEVLFPVKEFYYEMEKRDTQFEGMLIQIKQFHQLGLEDTMVVNLYDAETNLVNRLKGKKSPKQHQLEIFHNSEKFVYPLKTMKQERTEVIFKKPHPVVSKYWEERYDKISTYIRTQEERIQKEAPGELSHLGANLFVAAEWAEMVASNMKAVRKALEQATLQLEKIRHSYQNF